MRTSFFQMRQLWVFLLLLRFIPWAHADETSNCNDILASAKIKTERIVYNSDQTALVTGKSHFRHFAMKEIQFGDQKQFSTTIYFPTRDVDPQNATVVVALFHGLNATISHAGSMLNVMQNMTKREENIEPGSLLDQMRQRTQRVQGIYPEAPDLPGCGSNSDVKPFDTFEGTIDYYTQYLQDLRARSGRKPLIAVGFCYSAGYLVEVNRRHPGLIDGMILMGMIVPDPRMGLDFSIGVETKMYEAGTIVSNDAVLLRANRAYLKLSWLSEQQPFLQTPTLLLQGEHDPFMSAEATNLYVRWEQNNPGHIKLLVVPGGAHGVLGPIEGKPESSLAVLIEVNDFIARVLRGK